MKIRSLPCPLPGAALFGKLPCALDYVRAHHDSAESIALDRWLQAALQRLSARNLAWPSEPLAFTFSIEAGHSLVGVVADSCDRARRRFPVAVYVRVPRPEQLLGASATLVRASEAFLEDARTLVADRAQLSQTDIPPRLRRLRTPRADDVAAAAEAFAGELLTRSWGGFAAPSFSAARTLEHSARSAFEHLLSQRTPAGTAIECFDCPVESTGDVAVWLDGLEHSYARPCAALWALSGCERALIAPGPLPARAALFWAQPAVSHPQLFRIGAGATRRGQRSAG